MQPSTILVGLLAAFATASVVRSPQPNPEPAGLEGIQNLVDTVNNFPGLDAVMAIFKSLKKDKTWKADYSDKANGHVKMTDVEQPTCELAKTKFQEYEKDWSKYVKATFNTPCNGGDLRGMKEEHIDKMRKMIGDGH